jgi:hypothetical protein
MANFNRERIPERQPHAKGGGAFGTFIVTQDISRYTKAAVFAPGTETEVVFRFSTVAGERGSPDTWRGCAWSTRQTRSTTSTVGVSPAAQASGKRQAQCLALAERGPSQRICNYAGSPWLPTPRAAGSLCPSRRDRCAEADGAWIDATAGRRRGAVIP